MKVIPVINCPDFDCVKRRLDIVRELGSEWVEIDVSDGKFASGVTWNNPNELSSSLKSPRPRQGEAEGGQISNLRFAVHLMVMEPESYVSDWLKAGAKRIIVHVESEFDLERIKKFCDESNAELMLALKPDTPVEEIALYVNGQRSPQQNKFGAGQAMVIGVQLLAVNPGPSGQDFQEKTLAKIRLLREKLPDVKIEVDGGINP